MNESAHACAVRAAVASDAAGLAHVAAATFLETFAGILDGGDIVAHCQREHVEAAYARWLGDPACRLWLATAAPGGAPVGYLLLAPSALPIDDPQPGDLEIKRIYLLAPFQGGGNGRRLLEAAITHARQLRCPRLLLGVYAGNEAAQAFYARCGFVAHGSRRFRVGGNEYDDRILALDLQDPS